MQLQIHIIHFSLIIRHNYDTFLLYMQFHIHKIAYSSYFYKGEKGRIL